MSPECIHASSEILYNLHPSYSGIDPCTDFEQFACGGWQERHDIRSDQGETSVAIEMTEKAQTLLRHILEASSSFQTEKSSSESSIDDENFTKLKDAYDACMDERSIKSVGSAPLQSILNQVRDIYQPRTTQREEALAIAASLSLPTDKNLTRAILLLLDIGVEALLSFSISVSILPP